MVRLNGTSIQQSWEKNRRESEKVIVGEVELPEKGKEPETETILKRKKKIDLVVNIQEKMAQRECWRCASNKQNEFV